MSLTENDIRPAELEAGKLKALQVDLARLTEQKGSFVSAACPACDASDGAFEFEKFGFSFDKCPHCGTAYMNPRATPEILADFYANSVLYEYWDKNIFPASRNVRMETLFGPRVERILALCSKLGIAPGVLVEVGSASGMFCEKAVESGAFKRVIGIEPSAAQAATSRKRGLEVVEATIEEVDDLGTPVNVMASFETIEHLYAPKDFLQRCHKLLSAGGLLALSCPNYEGFDIMTLGPLSESLDAEHVNMFNPRSLRGLLERIGFDVVELTTPGQLDAELVRKKAIDGAIDISEHAFLRKVLIDEWGTLGEPFQKFLSDNLLSSHMWVAALKRD